MSGVSVKNPKIVSLYSGAGGLDYGFEAAGFEIAVATDIDANCCATLASNREWPVACGDICQITSKELLDAASLSRGEVDLIMAGPPCQPFSKSGYWVNGDTRRLDDPRAVTLDEFMRCVEEMLPKAFLLENVHGINYSGKEEGFQLLERLTRSVNERHGTNYELSWSVLNAADYGVPQIRQRFFLVGHREGRRFSFPAPTHHAAGEDSREPWVTAWDAIGDVVPSGDEDLSVKGKWADLLPSIPEGENYLWHTDRKGGVPIFKWRSRYWSFLLKLAKNRPSWTIQAQPGPAIGPFHWQNRLLSVSEMARLQTFPDDVEFVGSRRSVQMQIGNAVPSLLAEVLARAIAQQFFGRDYDHQPRLSVPLRRPTPEPEPVGPVPDKYKALGDAV